MPEPQGPPSLVCALTSAERGHSWEEGMATEGMREHVLSGVTSGRVLGRTVGACEEDTNRGSLLPLLSGPARSFRSK